MIVIQNLHSTLWMMFHVCFYATLYTSNSYRCAQLAALWEKDKKNSHDKWTHQHLHNKIFTKYT